MNELSLRSTDCRFVGYEDGNGGKRPYWRRHQSHPHQQRTQARRTRSPHGHRVTFFVTSSASRSQMTFSRRLQPETFYCFEANSTVVTRSEVSLIYFFLRSMLSFFQFLNDFFPQEQRVTFVPQTSAPLSYRGCNF